MLRCFPKYYCRPGKRRGRQAAAVIFPCWRIRSDNAACKAHLKLAKSRARLLKHQIHASSGAARREIARLLAEKKEVKARIRAEQFIQDQHTGLALDIFESLCETLSCRMTWLFTNKNEQCPVELLSVVHSILYCEPRLKIKELRIVRKALQRKFGKEWVEEAVTNRSGDVNFRLAHLLNQYGSAITEFSIVALMHSISQEYGIDWVASIPFETVEQQPRGTLGHSHLGQTVDLSPPKRDAPEVWPSIEMSGSTTWPSRGAWMVRRKSGWLSSVFQLVFQLVFLLRCCRESEDPAVPKRESVCGRTLYPFRLSNIKLLLRRRDVKKRWADGATLMTSGLSQSQTTL